MKELSPRYNPKEIEDKWYEFWTKEELFKPETGKNTKEQPYTIVIPPPNVTGILHMGHGLNNTIQDILIRYKRMQGHPALWIPGTDHAGIATQNVVEKALRKENKTRHNLGREKFIEKVWQWKEDHGSTIITQLKKLGCSCDWSRERFTLDEGLSSAVLEVFTALYKKGLIYRSNYIINWCPRCHTALSDEEVQHLELEGNLYYIKYPVADDDREFVTIATTRPETLLADVAIGVNPEDKRYKSLLGKSVILPLVGRELPIITDDVIDPHFGTGSLKITPAHDPVDFEIGLRHKLTPINIFNEDATMNENAPERFQGLDRIECRKAIVEELKKKDFLLKIESHPHAVGHCYRCDTTVEPRVSLQWFVNMKPLAEPAIKAVKEKQVQFVPERWTKVYLEWMENIRDWCISRQIWWGHRIPVYYCADCDEFTVSKQRPEKCPKCASSDITQDPDVLDTWFSSWLWPFSTLGWPNEKDDLKKFYPTSTLVTAQEIIFFWVARMIMSGFEFMGKAPFSHVYIHGTVRDDSGTKMSKSLGNVIDPIEIIDEFGADALRFSLIFITAKGQDVFLAKEKFHVGRNFANKIWNASRLIFMNIEEPEKIPDISRIPSGDISLADNWILSRLNETIQTVTDALEDFKFNEAENAVYEFFWHSFCDWYLEIVKKDLKSNYTVQAVTLEVLSETIKLLHPFMPFITEELWQILLSLNTPYASDKSIMTADWPESENNRINKSAQESVAYLTDIVVTIRNIRAEMEVSPSVKPDCIIAAHSEEKAALLKEHSDLILLLSNINSAEIDVEAQKPPLSATGIVGTTEIFIKLEGIIDIEVEKMRLLKKIQKKEKELSSSQARLDNADFVKKAPKEVIERAEELKKSIEEELEKLKTNLAVFVE